MNHRHQDPELKDIEGFESLEAEYQAHSTESPDPILDKQIIAAAHRELANPVPRELPKASWWRRLSLPVYAATILTCSVVATQFYWPEPIQTLPGTSSGPVQFEVGEPTLKQAEPQPRQSRKLPDPPEILQRPDLQAASDSQSEQSINAQSDTTTVVQEEGTTSDSSNNSAGVVQKNGNDSHAAQLGYKKPDIWAREIVELMKKGEHEAARNSLVRFKRAYPDYPIEEQLEVLR